MSTPTEGFDLPGEKKVVCEVRDEWDQPGEGKVRKLPGRDNGLMRKVWWRRAQRSW